jgi:hypothetical protein
MDARKVFLIIALICFGYEAIAGKSVLAAGLAFLTLALWF